MLTPNNRGLLKLKNPAVIADCWIDRDDVFLVNTGLTDNQKDQLILAACAYVNGYTKRYFNQQTADYQFKNVPTQINGYETYVLPNSPVSSISDAYLQVQGQFSEISLQYLELFEESGVFNLLPYPEQLTNISFNVVYASLKNKTSLWIRYESGYEPTDVPQDVKQATAYVYNHFFNMSQDTASVESFKTQNYSQKNATPDKSPNLVMAHNILNRYKKRHVA